MEEQFEEINLHYYYKVLANRKNIIFTVVLITTILSFIYSFLSPKIYETQSVIKIPLITASDGTQYPLISVSEAILRIESIYKQEFFGDDAKQIADLKVQKIDDTTLNSFLLTIQVKTNPKLAIKVTNKMLSYFQNNKSINYKRDKEKTDLTNKFSNVSRTLNEAKKIKNRALALLEKRDSIGFNPVDLESKISELEDKKANLELKLKSFEDFGYINKPYESSQPIKPEIFQNVVLGFTVSLLGGVLLAFFIENVIEPKETRVSRK